MHTMVPIVLRHTMSPRISPGPRNTVPQDTGRTQEHRRGSKPIVGAPAHRQCLAHGQCPAYGRCSGPLSVPRQKNRGQAPSTTPDPAEHL
jgi:hypothetical protein